MTVREESDLRPYDGCTKKVTPAQLGKRTNRREIVEEVLLRSVKHLIESSLVGRVKKNPYLRMQRVVGLRPLGDTFWDNGVCEAILRNRSCG